jgi:hypothetical protein
VEEDDRRVGERREAGVDAGHDGTHGSVGLVRLGGLQGDLNEHDLSNGRSA